MENILKNYFGCENPFDDYGKITPEGEVAQEKLIQLVKDLALVIPDVISEDDARTAENRRNLQRLRLGNPCARPAVGTIPRRPVRPAVRLHATLDEFAHRRRELQGVRANEERWRN